MERRRADYLMAYTFSVGTIPGTAPAAMYLLKATLVTAGWIVKSDSDGLTYASGGGQVTSGGAGAGGLGNSKAWIRIQAPTVENNTREIVFQRSDTAPGATGDEQWRIKYSANAGFTGGSPGILQTPSAVDEVVMAGAGTDASPTWQPSVFTTNNTYRMNISAGGADEYYSFAAWTHISGSLTGLNAIALDVMQSGSYPPEDVDPAVMYVSQQANFQTPFYDFTANVNFSTTNVTFPAVARAWMGATSSAGILTLGTNNNNVTLSALGGNWGAGATGAPNPFSTKDSLVSPWWGRGGSAIPGPNGPKGVSTLFRIGSTNRTNLDTCDLSSTKDRILMYYVWVPWNGTVPPL